MLYVAVRAARRAGDLIARAFDRQTPIHFKEKSDRDYVTHIDQQAEELILNEIIRHYPTHGIVAEESGRQNNTASIQWHVDPLDGTANFVNGYPHISVSISAWKDGKPLLGVIHDPLRNETFEAQAGEGAFLDRRRLRVKPKRLMRDAFFASGLPSYRRDGIDNFQKRMDSCMRKANGYRRGGSAALDLAYVACGRLDGYWEAGLGSWDIAAGIVLVREAGGIVTNLEGGDINLASGDVLASTPALHSAFVKLLEV
ncbi:MAG: inositol monophosphatase family protein [Mariprofundales bacterium]